MLNYPQTSHTYAIGWALLSGVLLSSGPSTIVPYQNTPKTGYYCNRCVAKQRSKTVRADDYLAQVRRDPRRKAAMDRVSRKIAARLDANTSGMTIVSLRLLQGLTQSELAQKTGLPQPYLSRIENHRQSLYDQTVEKLAAALTVSPEEIRQAFNNQWQYLESLKS
ncbi:helix-turn-helix transcriptional regulator [Eikenella corrodens]|uniref:helix-turn-helix domain-containing protein n=1 Tax=Eikenella corrodens TaxID=539 RepID=UPI0028EE574C|nr:helix-turn-helix transcriptional regulator [Eikenella corrodens]